MFATSEAEPVANQRTPEIKQEDEVCRESEPLSVPLRMSSLGQTDIKQDDGNDGNESTRGSKQESTTVRINEWRNQASAVSVAEENTPRSSTQYDSYHSSRPSMDYCPPAYTSPMRPASHPPRQMPISASYNNLIQRPTPMVGTFSAINVSGNVSDFHGRRSSMQSAPTLPPKASIEAPELPWNHAKRSRAASKLAYDILAGQIKRRDDEENRRNEEAESFEGLRSEFSAAFL